ncbi:hypothetical protein BT96DRAFT_950871, partial [Gymnopus androsaceus JB14]
MGLYDVPPVHATWPPTQPSLTWLLSPGWTDGCINPPVMYTSVQHMRAVQDYWKHTIPPKLRAPAQPAPVPLAHPPSTLAPPVFAPTPVPPLPMPAPCTTGTIAVLSGTYYRQSEFGPSQSESRGPHAITQANNHYESKAADNSSLNNTDYLISVIKFYSAVDASAPTKLGKLKVKKESSQLTDRIPITTLTRQEFITRFLKVHNLDEKYAPGPHSGPTFKVYWSGFICLVHWVSGTKTAATIVLDDHQYQI